VVVDSNNRILFLLAGIADDLEMETTRIVRGSDHLNGTAIQLDMCAAAGKTPPKTAHLPLISGANNKPLSKRNSEELSINNLQKAGFEAMALANFMVLWGGSYADPKPCYNLAELAKLFDLKNTSKASLAIAAELLARENTKFIRQLPFSEATKRASNLTQQVWDAIAPNIEQMSEVEHWQTRLAKGFKPAPTLEPEERQLIALARDIPFTNFEEWHHALAERSGKKGGKLFKPLRMALVGVATGIPMGELCHILGAEEITARLKEATSKQ